jgi:hypothetical protein
MPEITFLLKSKSSSNIEHFPFLEARLKHDRQITLQLRRILEISSLTFSKAI